LAHKAFEQADIRLNVIAEVDSLPTLKAAVNAQLGYSLLPWSAVSRDVESGQLAPRPLANASEQREVALCRSNLLPTSNAALAVFSLIRLIVISFCEQQTLRGMYLVD
jgi:LysR family transcriptional regulator, nitrogen assimilation regulatory protein